jgi:lysophospholipase L1-like esterase
MRRGTESILQYLTALVVTVVTLGLLELACTLYLSSFATNDLPQDPKDDSVERTMRFLSNNPAPLVEDLDLLWRNEPATTRTQVVYPRAHGRDDMWTVAINGDGFRGPERSRSAASRRPYRVLCIGDSVTFGYNVDQGAEYPRRLEEILRRDLPGRPIEVVNAAVPGWTWVQGRHFLETEGLRLRPDLVVVAHGTNDRFWTATTTDAEHIWLLGNPVLRGLQATVGRVQRTATYRTLASFMPPPPPRAPSPGCEAQLRLGKWCHRVSLEEIDAAIREAHRLTEEAGIDLVVMNVDFLGTGAGAAVRRAAEREKIPFLDQVATFTTLYIGELLMRSWDLGVQPARVPTLRLRSAGPSQPKRTQRLLLRVLVERPDAEVHVRGGQLIDEEPVDQPMYDDGSHGDERADDGIFTTTVRLPDEARVFRYRYYMNGEAEFAPPPSYPEAWGNRVLKLADDAIGPVDLFGELFLMAENVHPDALGHQIIATSLADEIERLASFRDFVQDSDP